jgi:hypothetical protein
MEEVMKAWTLLAILFDVSKDFEKDRVVSPQLNICESFARKKSKQIRDFKSL